MKFDTTINVSNVITFGTIFLTAALWMNSQFHALDLRISTIETTLNRLANLDDRLDNIEDRVLILETL